MAGPRATSTKPPERPPLRRDTIVDAAREIVRSDGLDGLSLRRLAADLGVTAPALYAHVEDKRDLLRAVAEVEFDRLVRRFEAVETQDPIERIRAHCRAYVDHARENPELFDIMFLFPPDIGGAAVPEGAVLPAATRAFTVALAAVDDAMRRGLLDGDDPLLVSLTLWTATHGVASALQLGLALPTEVEERLIAASIDRLIQGWCSPA